jgi:hypothetical protein
MIKPVLGGIFDEREFLQDVAGDVFIYVQQNTQTCLCDEGMGGCHGNMVTVGNCVAFFGETGRRQELSDRKV